MDTADRVQTSETPYPEPSGMALKAAYLLLRELNKSPEPPTMEGLAVLLEKVLRFPELITLLKEAHEVMNGCGTCDSFMREPLNEFESWVNDKLIR